MYKKIFLNLGPTFILPLPSIFLFPPGNFVEGRENNKGSSGSHSLWVLKQVIYYTGEGITPVPRMTAMLQSLLLSDPLTFCFVFS